jgi:hypothetical protein
VGRNRSTLLIGDGEVQQLNVNDYYDLGKAIDQLEREVAKIENEVELKSIVWSMFMVRWHFQKILSDPCALLPSSQRAAHSVVSSISSFVPDDVSEAFAVSDRVQAWKLSSVTGALKNFETVLQNDMPEMSTFAVAQIGIYRTENLINKAYLQIDESIRPLLLPLALNDVTEAGKCLAFRVPTAAAFHLSRAIETGMNQYYEALTGKPFALKDAAKNWAIKTQALKDARAEEKITEFLVHIRKGYRNPITHPDVILEPTEAFNFFPQAISVISMMLEAVKDIKEKNQPMLSGLVSTLPRLVEPIGDEVEK